MGSCRWFCWSVLFTLAAGAVLANWNDTSTGIDLDKLPGFPLTKIRSTVLNRGERATFDGIVAIPDFRPAWPTVHISGRGKSGKRWEAHTCLNCFAQAWRADLDGNGVPDYVFSGQGPYFNGRVTPLYSLTILLMDQEKLPVPYFTPLYFDDGIKRFVDLGNDKRPEFLISRYDENVSDPFVGPFCSGHWVTQLYRFQAAEVSEFRGTLGGIAFPFIHDWTLRGPGPIGCPQEDKPYLSIQPPSLGDHGTGASGELNIRIRSIKNDDLVDIESEGGCDQVSPETIVYEQGVLREIEFPILGSTYRFDLLRRIMADHAPVKLRGVNHPFRSASCSADLLWATQ